MHAEHDIAIRGQAMLATNFVGIDLDCDIVDEAAVQINVESIQIAGLDWPGVENKVRIRQALEKSGIGVAQTE